MSREIVEIKEFTFADGGEAQEIKRHEHIKNMTKCGWELSGGITKMLIGHTVFHYATMIKYKED
jgi:hypothetical protein